MGDQKLCCPDANEYLAETDTDKASTFLQSIQLNQMVNLTVYVTRLQNVTVPVLCVI